MNLPEDMYPSLFQLFGGYFHQDFYDDYSGPEEALTQFLRENNKERIRSTLSELEQSLSQNVDEGALSRFIFSLGCYYDPRLEGLSTSRWLHHVRERIQRFLNEKRHNRTP